MLAAGKGTLELVITHGGSYNCWVVFSTAVHYMLSSSWVCVFEGQTSSVPPDHRVRRLPAVALLTASLLGSDCLAPGRTCVCAAMHHGYAASVSASPRDRNAKPVASSPVVCVTDGEKKLEINHLSLLHVITHFKRVVVGAASRGRVSRKTPTFLAQCRHSLERKN